MLFNSKIKTKVKLLELGVVALIKDSELQDEINTLQAKRIDTLQEGVVDTQKVIICLLDYFKLELKNVNGKNILVPKKSEKVTKNKNVTKKK